MKLSITGIYRETEFSPGKIDADRQIMDAALEELRAAGAEAGTLTAHSFIANPAPSADVVLAMCQSAPALERLAALESAGAVVINSALGIRNCYRDLLGPGLVRAALPTPRGCVVRTGEPLAAEALEALDLAAPIFVKRGDLHALGPEDVQRVATAAELDRVLDGFRMRGIEIAYLQQEVAGTVVKFYGVGDGGKFFRAVAPDGFTLPAPTVRDLAATGAAAASALGVEVWGGDAIIADAAISLIDFNDWPSFGSVVDGAARAIAEHALARTSPAEPSGRRFK